MKLNLVKATIAVLGFAILLSVCFRVVGGVEEVVDNFMAMLVPSITF